MLTPEACTAPETTHRLYEVQEIKKTKQNKTKNSDAQSSFTKNTLTNSVLYPVLHVCSLKKKIFTHQENFDYFQVASCFTCTLCSLLLMGFLSHYQNLKKKY